jgi:hypothetical protein
MNQHATIAFPGQDLSIPCEIRNKLGKAYIYLVVKVEMQMQQRFYTLLKHCGK